MALPTALQNIDPVFILQPLIVIIASTALLTYWRRKPNFHMVVLVYSLAAYASAIALKYAVQISTVNVVTGYFGANSIGTGLYYGLQAALFEVGLAFVFARYAVRRRRLGRKDAGATVTYPATITDGVTTWTASTTTFAASSSTTFNPTYS